MPLRIFIVPIVALVTTLGGIVPALAHDGVKIEHAYARFLPGAKSGVIYMDIMNHSLSDDRLLSARTPVAAKVEAHANVESADGVMSMQPLNDGVLIPGLETVRLGTGGLHLMVTGLTTVPKDAETFPLTLTFARSGDITLDVVVDNKRKAEAEDGMVMDQDMSTMSN